MTNAERIRTLTDEELVDLLVWRRIGILKRVPECDEGCLYEDHGCALRCPHDRREAAVRAWLKEEE